MKVIALLVALLVIVPAVLCGVTLTRNADAPGDGKTFPKAGDTVKVHYTGTLASGDKRKFDSSVDRNQPFITKIGVGHVIKCWDEGMLQLSVGEKATLHCSSDYAYGSRGAGSVIPPNADLNFDVELIEIMDQ